MIPDYMEYYCKAIIIGAVIILSSIVVAFSAPVLPNPLLTPGDVYTTDANVACNAHTGSEKDSIRSVPSSVAKQVYKNYGILNHTGYCGEIKFGCETDHLVSLKIGGANSIKNLWPQSYGGKQGAFMKDTLEKRLIARVCRTSKKHPIKLDIKVAQKVIAENWISAYQKYVVEDQ